MAERVPILDGEHWVVLRDLDTVTNRQRKPYTRIFHKQLKGFRPDADADSAFEYGAAVAFMVLGDWSFDFPLPTEWDLFLLLLEDQPARITDAVTIASIVYLRAIEAREDDAVPPPNRAARRKAANAA